MTYIDVAFPYKEATINAKALLITQQHMWPANHFLCPRGKSQKGQSTIFYGKGSV